MPIAAASDSICLGRPRGHEGHRPGQDPGVGLGVGAAADPDQGLADHVMEGEHPGVDRVAAEDRAERQGGAVARRPAPGRARRRSARRRAARSSARPGWRTACRASRPRGRGRSSRSPAAAARAAPVIASGSAITRSGRTSAATRSSAPAGTRWMPVISAPESVVGIAATAAPLTEAIAFAVSITRPPPKATRRSPPAVVEQRRGGVGDLAGPAPRGPPRRRRPAARRLRAPARW